MYTIKQLATFAVAGVLGSLSITACDLDVPDLNNPGLDELQDNPTAALVESACTGLLIGSRRNVANENGYVSQLGILGREAYNFDTADPRYITEMLDGQLNQASPFGGNFWALPYTNIRLANIILQGVVKVAEFKDTEKAAIRGFTHTMQALDLLEVILTHDTNGAVIDTDQVIVSPPAVQPLGAIVGKDATYAKIAGLLDDAVQELGAGGDAFPFKLPSDYHNDDPKLTFDTPAGFLRLNRAIRARAAAYRIAEPDRSTGAARADYATVLTALAMSFIDDVSPAIPFNFGVYYVYSTKSGDATNGLINSNIYAHPSLATDAVVGGATDTRFARKVGPAKKPGANAGLGSSLAFKLYPEPSSPVALIRNEELILLKAEALFFTGDTVNATKELNLVRQQSGGLPALAETTDGTTFVDELLYERRYSLLFEGGHRWIDLRRFGRMLPIDRPDDARNVRYPIPQAECDARPGELACTLGSE